MIGLLEINDDRFCIAYESSIHPAKYPSLIVILDYFDLRGMPAVARNSPPRSATGDAHHGWQSQGSAVEGVLLNMVSGALR
jgi:hypothetical protein